MERSLKLKKPRFKTKVLFGVWTIAMMIQAWAFRRLIRLAMEEAGLTLADVLRSVIDRPKPSSPGGWG
jgi:hypothetical protein